MIGLTLFCTPGKEHHDLVDYSKKIWYSLAFATAQALDINGELVSLRIIPSASVNSTGLELIAEVDSGTTPQQDMTEWKKALIAAWEKLRHDDDLKDIRYILRKSVGIWARTVEADYGALPEEKD